MRFEKIERTAMRNETHRAGCAEHVITRGSSILRRLKTPSIERSLYTGHLSLLFRTYRPRQSSHLTMLGSPISYVRLACSQVHVNVVDNGLGADGCRFISKVFRSTSSLIRRKQSRGEQKDRHLKAFCGESLPKLKVTSTPLTMFQSLN